MNTAYRGGFSAGRAVRVFSMLALVLVVLASRQVLAGENTLIPEAKVTSEAVLEALKNAGVSASLDADGDVEVTVRGLDFWMQGDVDKGRIYMFYFRSTKDDATMEQRQALAHAINDGLVLVRATITPKGRLWLDYAFPTEAGITGAQIVNLVKRFGTIINMVDDVDEGNLLQ